VAAIENTRDHIFVTGRAGTGKSTLLEYLSWHSSHTLAICAPTGVAALNVGGQTIHSLFRLPIGVIADHDIDQGPEVRKLLSAIDTLVIDEVSMVNADLMDAIDRSLRQARSRPHEAFGGTQIILFGDPYLWQEYFAIWEARWPERVVEFPTNVERRMDDAITRFLEHFKGAFTHNGDKILTLHAKSAALTKGKRRAPRPEDDPGLSPYYFKVQPKKQGLFIDTFVAGILAEVARGQAIEKGALAPPPEPLVEWSPR